MKTGNKLRRKAKLLVVMSFFILSSVSGIEAADLSKPFTYSVGLYGDLFGAGMDLSGKVEGNYLSSFSSHIDGSAVATINVLRNRLRAAEANGYLDATPTLVAGGITVRFLNQVIYSENPRKTVYNPGAPLNAAEMYQKVSAGQYRSPVTLPAIGISGGQKWTKSVSGYRISYPVAFFVVNVNAGASGELGYKYSAGLDKATEAAPVVPGQRPASAEIPYAQATGEVRPYAGFGAFASAEASVVIASLGVQGTLSLVKNELVTGANAHLTWKPSIELGIYDDLTGPGGKLEVYAKWRQPSVCQRCWSVFGKRICAYYPCFNEGSKYWTLADWAGSSNRYPLARGTLVPSPPAPGPRP